MPVVPRRRMQSFWWSYFLVYPSLRLLVYLSLKKPLILSSSTGNFKYVLKDYKYIPGELTIDWTEITACQNDKEKISKTVSDTTSAIKLIINPLSSRNHAFRRAGFRKHFQNEKRLQEMIQSLPSVLDKLRERTFRHICKIQPVNKKERSFHCFLMYWNSTAVNTQLKCDTTSSSTTFWFAGYKLFQRKYLRFMVRLKNREQPQQGRKEMFYLTTHSTHLRLYGVGHMVKDHSDSERGNPLPPHGLLFPINSKVFFICTIPQTW